MQKRGVSVRRPVMEGGAETHSRPLKMPFSGKETKHSTFLCSSVEVSLDVFESIAAVTCICVSPENITSRGWIYWKKLLQLMSNVELFLCIVVAFTSSLTKRSISKEILTVIWHSCNHLKLSRDKIIFFSGLTLVVIRLKLLPLQPVSLLLPEEVYWSEKSQTLCYYPSKSSKIEVSPLMSYRQAGR